MGDSLQFLDIIFFAMIAGFILLRLRSVLGRRGGPKSARDLQSRKDKEDNVVQLPEQDDDNEDIIGDYIDLQSESEASDVLAGVRIADPTFDEKDFLVGARIAYEMIVSSFASGDTDTLRPMLNDEVYKNFATAIQEREQRGESLETTLLAIQTAEIIEASAGDDIAVVTVKFTSEMIKLTRDSAGEVISGDSRDVLVATDIWTFERDIKMRDPNWTLTATRSPH